VGNQNQKPEKKIVGVDADNQGDFDPVWGKPEEGVISDIFASKSGKFEFFGQPGGAWCNFAFICPNFSHTTVPRFGIRFSP